MTNPVEIQSVLTWPQAVVAVFVLLALVVWPGVLAWLNSKNSRSTTQDIKTTLTKNNGGGSVKDALDRIEAHQKKTDERLAAIEERLPAQRE